MTLVDLETGGWLHKHLTPKQELLELLNTAESDLMDARREFPAEWKFGLACTAALNLCTTLLNASGYRAEDQSQLEIIHTLPLILGDRHKPAAAYLESCIKLRNQKNSEQSEPVTSKHAVDLVRFVEDFYLHVIKWLRKYDSSLTINCHFSLVSGAEQGLSLVEA